MLRACANSVYQASPRRGGAWGRGYYAFSCKNCLIREGLVGYVVYTCFNSLGKYNT